MNSLSSLSIKNRIMIAMLLAVLVSSSIITYVGQRNAKSHLLDRLEHSELPNLVQRVRNSVNSEIQQMKVVTRALAGNTLFLNWLENGTDASTEKLVVDYLGKIARDNGFSNASFADKESQKYWNQDGFLRVLTPDRDGWFFKFKSSGNSESASVYRSTTSDKVDIFVNYQQLNGRGVSGVSKSFKEMVDYLNSFRIEQSGFVYLVDGKGLVKVHKQDSLNDSGTLSGIYAGVDTNQLISIKDFAFATTDELVVATSYIESLGWYVVAEIPKQELYAGIEDAQVTMLIIFAVVSVAFLVISYFLADNLTKPIKKMAITFTELGEGEGDLTSRVSEEGAEEISSLAKGFNSFVSNIQTVVIDVTDTSKEVRNASTDVYKDAEASKVASDKQRDEAHQVSVAINEMGSTIAEIANNAGVAAQTTNEASTKALDAQHVVNDSTDTINKMAEEMETVSSNIETLAEKSDAISGVLDVIRGISEQTNLLALNAAIEAARAGEQGRGFAVVADEVRSLAQRTSESTDEIHEMITELQDGAKVAVDSVHKSREQAVLGVEAAQRTNSALEEIVADVQHISDLNTQVATATEEQSVVINEINIHVVNISDSTELSAEACASIESSSDSLKSSAVHLDGLVSRFKV
ncbi:methyl-accepting chemotaxis protein [Vibrio hannami]|uniref:methyl-accepting chemotaxis protein n=1 Tax=Vibrio hannami TaxID=2717094 RepID=UPI00240FD301|nr:methyl-accepting chemotaxis protein [Vibrio hannami]MDG3088326.1 methyl-accepting chemotaxis protein [Vibrio hannami]